MTESGIIGMTWAGMAATKLRRFRFRSGVKDSKWVEDIPAKHKNVDDVILGHSYWKQFIRSNANYFSPMSFSFLILVLVSVVPPARTMIFYIPFLLLVHSLVKLRKLNWNELAVLASPFIILLDNFLQHLTREIRKIIRTSLWKLFWTFTYR